MTCNIRTFIFACILVLSVFGVEPVTSVTTTAATTTTRATTVSTVTTATGSTVTTATGSTVTTARSIATAPFCSVLALVSGVIAASFIRS